MIRRGLHPSVWKTQNVVSAVVGSTSVWSTVNHYSAVSFSSGNTVAAGATLGSGNDQTGIGDSPMPAAAYYEIVLGVYNGLMIVALVSAISISHLRRIISLGTTRRATIVVVGTTMVKFSLVLALISLRSWVGVWAMFSLWQLLPRRSGSRTSQQEAVGITIF